VKKICLVFPRFRYKSGDPPLGLCSVASYVRENCDVEISLLDTTFHPSFEYVLDYLEAKRPDIVGIYISTPMYDNALSIAQIAKQMGMYVVAGGPHATICPDSLIHHVDVVALGEGEETMRQIIQIFPSNDMSKIKGIWYKENAYIRKNPLREPLYNLDSLQFPALDLVDMERYTRHWHYLDSLSPRLKGINVIASRGCSFNCSFCQPALRMLFGNGIRYKSPEYLVREIFYYMENYKVNCFFFHDDALGENKKWSYMFFDILEKENIHITWGCNCRTSGINEQFLRRMYDVGGRCIHLGIESGSQRVLDEIYQKGIRLNRVKEIICIAKKIGLRVGGFFMLGAPGETKSEIFKTIKFAISSSLDEASFSIATPFPGTRLYDMVKNDRKYWVSTNYSDFDYYRMVSYYDTTCPQRKLHYFQRKGLILFYLHPWRWLYVFKQIFSLQGLIKFHNKIRRFF